MPNENIMGIPTKACINGITKADALEIRKIPTLESETTEIVNNTIPSLDDRITALEEGGGSSINQNLTIVPLNEISSLFEEITEESEGRQFTYYKVKNDFKIVFNVEITDTLPATYNSIEFGTRFREIITIPKDTVYPDLTYFLIGKSLISSTYSVSSSNETVIYSLINIDIYGLSITNGTELAILFNDSGIVNDKRNNASIIDSFVKSQDEISVNYLTSLEDVESEYGNNFGIAFVK